MVLLNMLVGNNEKNIISKIELEDTTNSYTYSGIFEENFDTIKLIFK